MKILSLFDGISCARVACDRAGIPVEEYTASEIDKYAIQVSQKNYPDMWRMGDVKNCIFADKHFDLLIGGSPCQDLSIAKANRKGLEGARSGLFYEYVRILKEAKPKFFVLENVASMPKEAKATITEELWGIEPVMINAALVSAQNRKRLFWVGKLVGDNYEQVEIPLPEDSGIYLKDILEREVEEKYNVTAKKSLNIKKYNGESGLNPNNFKGKGYIGGSKSVSLTLPSGNNSTLVVKDKEALKKVFNNYEQVEIPLPEDRGIMLKDILETGVDESYVVREKPEYSGKTTGKIGEVKGGGQGNRIYSDDGKSITLSASSGGTGGKTGLYLIKDQVRKLTPTECERLQGLPDNYTEGVSNTQRYKALGNAFNVDVVAHILKHLK